MGLPALDAFPRKIWARLGARCVRAMQPADMVHPSVYGLPALRAEIAAYLQVSRGIDCSPSQVFVTSGYRHTIELIAHALLKAGDRVWLEDPGYPPTRELLAHMNIAAVPVPVDREGMVVSEGIRLAPRARAAVVTPAHQSPLCVSLSLPRRLALLDWAARNNAWIIEDDYDGEYRYVSRPLPALKSLDRDGRVLYAGTFSKVLFPSLRLAYLVVPEAQVERFEQISQVFAGRQSRADAGHRHGLHHRRAFRAPHPAHAQALCRAPGSDGGRPGKRAGQTRAHRFAAGRHAPDPAAARPAIGPPARGAHAGRGPVRQKP